MEHRIVATGDAVKERLSEKLAALNRADRISLLVVGIGIVVINAILIGLLFSP